MRPKSVRVNKAHIAKNCSGASAFTLIEVVASLFILALAAIVCVSLTGVLRRGYASKVVALEGAPAAMEFLHDGLSGEGFMELVQVLEGEEAPVRIVWMEEGQALDKDSTGGEADEEAESEDEAGDGSGTVPLWHYADPEQMSELPRGCACVYVARLGSAEVRPGGAAVEFDVELCFTRPPLPDEGLEGYMAQLTQAEKVVSYREIVLVEGLVR